MLQEGFVLLFTVYTGNIPDNKPPTFYATKESCEATFLEIKHRETRKRRTTVEGGCFDMKNPQIRRYLKEELDIQERD